MAERNEKQIRSLVQQQADNEPTQAYIYNTGEFVNIHSVKSFPLFLITVRFNHALATLRAVQRQIWILYMLTYSV